MNSQHRSEEDRQRQLSLPTEQRDAEREAEYADLLKRLAEPTDTELLMKAIVFNVASWVPTCLPDWGEVRIEGILSATEIEGGLPVLNPRVREELKKRIAEVI